MIRCIALVIPVLSLPSVAAYAVPEFAGADLDTITKALSQQDNAWDDLDVHYTCEWWTSTESGGYKFDSIEGRYHWVITQKGWEKLWRAIPRQEGKQDIDAASFSGEYYMTWASQGEGSGRSGHKWDRFVNHPCSLKKLGIAVSGLELNQPLTVPNFLTSKKAAAKIVRVADGLIIVRGADPFADGFEITLYLDRRVGYRPVKIESTNEKGLTARFDGLEYRKLEGVRGHFWLPVRGVWNCFDSEKHTPTGQFRFEGTEVHVDRHPPREDFIFKYPAGTLFINTDTGESGYLRTASTTADLTNFSAKLMSYQEHDVMLPDVPLPDSADSREPTRWPMIIVINLGIVLILSLAFWIRHKMALRARRASA